jgi:ATP/maltotriose-dependent transcriptional regulator MalT
MGEGVFAATTGIDVALVELLGGDLVEAERQVREDYMFLVNAGEQYYLSTIAALLSLLVREQGRDAEALELSRQAESASAEDDFDSQALWRAIRAPILARAGELGEAESLARRAVELVNDSEAPLLKADAMYDLATVLQYCGKLDEARMALGNALQLCSAKAHRVGKERCEARLVELGGASQA